MGTQVERSEEKRRGRTLQEAVVFLLRKKLAPCLVFISAWRTTVQIHFHYSMKRARISSLARTGLWIKLNILRSPCIHPWRGDWDPRGFNRGLFFFGGFPLGFFQCQEYEGASKQSLDWCNADGIRWGLFNILVGGGGGGGWPIVPLGSTSDHFSTRHSDATHTSHSPEQWIYLWFYCILLFMHYFNVKDQSIGMVQSDVCHNQFNLDYNQILL